MYAGTGGRGSRPAARLRANSRSLGVQGCKALHPGGGGISAGGEIPHGGHGGETVDYLDPADVYVAFTKEQVKSAHNTGAFAEMGDKREHLMYQATA